jgi:hypothetical protein
MVRTLNILFHITWVIVVVHHSCWIPRIFQMATPQQKSKSILHLAKTESVTAVQCVFTHNFTQNYPAEYPFTPSARHLSRKGEFSKPRVVVDLLCLVQLWTMFRLASKTALKIQHAVDSVKLCAKCTLHSCYWLLSLPNAEHQPCCWE